MTLATQWIDAFAHRLGVASPDDDEVAAILSLAGVAAHASQRTAAPIACWLAARAGVEPARALELAQSIVAEHE